MSYGTCPICGANGIIRERRFDGNDICENKHTYPSKNSIKDRKQYEEDLKRRQEKHLKNIQQNRDSSWQPCMHDNCSGCVGTGITRNGSPCIHSISCPCPKCTPRC